MPFGVDPIRRTSIKKPTISALSSGFRSSNKLNENLQDLRDAFDNTLSRDGSTPNHMEAELDLNSNRIINLATPIDPTDAVTKEYADGISADSAQFYGIQNAVGRTVDSFGAAGDSTPTTAGTDDTEAFLEALAWANENGAPILLTNKWYNVRSTLELVGASIIGVGSTNSGTGAEASSGILFSHLGAAPAILVDLDTNKKMPTIKGFDMRAISWDPTTGCSGNGMEVSVRVHVEDVSIQHFGRHALFLHGGVSGNGPYDSRFVQTRFLYSGSHGVVVGTGANLVTFENCEFKWNGAPSYGVAPTVAGDYDGLYVDKDTTYGNPGSAYQNYWMEGLTIIGGDASYNSRYGWNFQTIRNSPNLSPGYAEFNKAADGFQAVVGLSVTYCHIRFGALSGGTASLKATGVYGEYAPTNQIYVGGKFLGGGGVYHPTGWHYADIGQVYAFDATTGDQVRSVASNAAIGKHKIRLDGTNAEWNVGYNLGEQITVSTANGVQLPAKERLVKVIDYIPLANRPAALASTFVADATAYVQAAINTGKNVDLGGLNLYVNNLVMANNQQELVSTAGTVNLWKNANGPILTVSGADVVVRDIIFRGQGSTYTGDNILVTGSRADFINCGSQDTPGRALKCTGDGLRVTGTNSVWRTNDATATGFEFEIGVSGTATLYHELHGIYTGSSLGGIQLIDTGSHVISGRGQFGKLHIKKGTGPAGTNGGMTSNSRILGDVTVEASNAVFHGNQFSTQTVTFAVGTGGCILDESNLTSGTTINNLGNGSSNLIARNVGTGAAPGGIQIKYGADNQTNPIVVTYTPDAGMRLSKDVILTSGVGAYRFRNNAGTADLAVISMSGASDSVNIGHQTGSGSSLGLNSNTGGINFWVNDTGTSKARMLETVFRPTTDNVMDLGASGTRWKDFYSIRHFVGTANLSITAGSGTPEGVVTAPVGSVFMRTDGGAGTTVYAKQSGTGNTGWSPLAAAVAGADTVTNVELANMATQTVKGRNTAGTGDPEDLSMTTLRNMLAAATFDSGELTCPSAAGPISPVAHSLGQVPKWTQAKLRCKTAELGYSVDDEVEVSFWAEGGAEIGLAVYANATNVGAVRGEDFLRVPNRTTGQASASVTPANWRLILRAGLL